MTTKVTKSGVGAIDQLSTASVKHTSSPVDNITLDANGRVGIGASSPSRKLHISDSGVTCGIRIDNTVSGRPALLLYDDSQNLTLINSSDTGYFAFVNGTGAGTERMRIDSAGRVTMPYQPFFSAKHNNGENPGTNGTFVNWAVEVNNGGNSFASGVYTVYTAGYYQIHAALLISPGGATGVYLNYNGTNYQRMFYAESSATNTYQMGAGSVIKYLNVGDSVKLTAQGSSTWYGDGNGLGNFVISMLG